MAWLSVIARVALASAFVGRRRGSHDGEEQSLKVSGTKSTERMEEHTREEGATFPQGERFVRVVWSMVDRYELLRMDRTPVESVAPWEIVLNTVVMDAYPRN